MTRLRVAAAIAALLTVFLLQATIISPLSPQLQISLPLVLVIAVALVDGPGAGLAFGFCAGLIADLASTHPAGVLALCWMGAGALAGLIDGRHRAVNDALRVACIGALATAASAVMLLVLHADGVIAVDLTRVPASGVFDGVLALVVVPLTRRFLESELLRGSRPVISALNVDGAHG